MSEEYKKIRETYKPRGEFKHRYWFFADTPNVAWIVSVIWKDLLWRADLSRLLKYRGGCTIPLFQLSVWCEKCAAGRHNSVIGNQLLFSNNRKRVRWVVLCLSQGGACTDSFEIFRDNSLKGKLSNVITLNPPLFSLVNTFKVFKIKSAKVQLALLETEQRRCTYAVQFSSYMRCSATQ